MLLLTLVLLAAQEWVPVVDGEGRRVEVTDVRADGADRRQMIVRVFSSDGHGAAVATIAVNCAARTSWMVGDAKLYADGEYLETRPAPALVGVERPVAGDPVAGPVLDYACGLGLKAAQ